MLPVQILIIAMGSINATVDGIFAGQYIGTGAIGAIGLFNTMERILEATGAVLIGGSAVLCGTSLGQGDRSATRGVISLSLTLALLAGAVLTAANSIAAGPMATLMGASTPELRSALISYERGYSAGIIGQLSAQLLASFLQLNHEYRRSYIGTGVMILSNIILDYLFVVVFQRGLWGLALATALSNWFYFLVLVPPFLKKNSILSYRFSDTRWSALGELVKVGFPGALLVFCLAARALVINRVLLTYAGSDGLSAMSAFNMVTILLICLPMGTGFVLRMLTSVFIGEEDDISIQGLFRIVFTRVLPVCIVIGIGLFFCAAPLAAVFIKDRTSNAFEETRKLFSLYSVCIPLVLICCVNSGYFQAQRLNLIVNIISVFDGFLSMVIPSLILAPILGATGIWISLVLGIVITASLGPLYAIKRNGHIPSSLSEWLLLPQIFPGKEKPHLLLPIRKMKDISPVSQAVQSFCTDHGVDGKTARYSALCIEEIAGNVVRYGFSQGKGLHRAEVFTMISEEGQIFLRVRDDCAPFDLTEWARTVSDTDPTSHIGIRMVMRMASEVQYQNLLGMNVLTMIVDDQEKETL